MLTLVSVQARKARTTTTYTGTLEDFKALVIELGLKNECVCNNRLFASSDQIDVMHNPRTGIIKLMQWKEGF